MSHIQPAIPESHLDTSPDRGKRLHFLDNLRTFLILLVVVYHAGIVYEASGVGAVFWIVDDPATNNLSGLFNLVFDVFVMAAIFFVSGYFAPKSLAEKGPRRFLGGKLRRLLLPWAIGVLTLVPLYKFFFLYSRGLPQEHWTTYFHFTNGIFSQSWLWFLPVLFLFDLAWVGLSGILSRSPAWSSKLSVRGAVLLTGLVGFVYGLGMDLAGWRGWTKTALVDFQNERLLIYFLLFALGALCFERRAFDRQLEKGWLDRLVSWFAWMPITTYLVFLLYPWLNPGKHLLSPLADRLIVWSSFQLALFCCLYGLLAFFQRRQNRTSPIRASLARHSYTVYIVHAIVLGALATALLPLAIPSLLKHLLLAIGTYLGSQGLAVLLSKLRHLAAPPRAAATHEISTAS